MGIGSKIKEYRTKCSLTQKELAEKLFVTYQAVSRWEKDEAEPSFDTLKEMTVIFGCTVDDLFGYDKKEAKNDDTIDSEVAISPQPIEKPVIAVCEQCKKPIREVGEVNHISVSTISHIGRDTTTNTTTKILCKSCNDARLLQEKRKKEQEEAERINNIAQRRLHSFIWPSLVTIILIILSIVAFTKGEKNLGTIELVIGLLLFPFLGCMILNNTFITDLWFEIASWGFVTMPGVIMEFSLDGILIGIAIKITLWLLGILLAVLLMILATIIAVPLSIFAYPFALRKSLKNLE